jgi:hypothetical protein
MLFDFGAGFDPSGGSGGASAGFAAAGSIVEPAPAFLSLCFSMGISFSF